MSQITKAIVLYSKMCLKVSVVIVEMVYSNCESTKKAPHIYQFRENIS